MAASAQGQRRPKAVPLLDLLTWTDTVLPLDLVLEQFHLPQIVKLADKNDPDFPGGAIVLLVGLRKENSRYVVARCMAGDRDRTMVGPWLSIPLSCKSRFVRMSSEQSIKKDRFHGVQELAENLPNKVIATQDVSESGNVLVNAGEEIRCLGIEGMEAKPSGKPQFSSTLPWRLACLNENNEYVRLSLECGAKFLAVAGGAAEQTTDDEATIDKLASDNFPLTVLQTNGETPKFCQDTFTGIFRLVQAREDRMISACLLRTGANGAVLYQFLELPASNASAVVLPEGMLKDQGSYNVLLMKCCEELKVWNNTAKDTGSITRVLNREFYFKNKFDGSSKTQRPSPPRLTVTPSVDEGLYAPLQRQSSPRDHTRPPTPPPIESLRALTISRRRYVIMS
ncbi:PREDICTED: GRB2-associated and regulator of MAPK protein 1-like [Branchiostoma belcheri]|uniref:GRB2-associated and regulator of MAPK protein 1-like n=1 Tax=Branchiostoma belcheri TaxID=7741 RepID=A0A6P4XD61_BRABE|nr:PREDICTED: GRB2-associated and regulator of MAPK protein 1-like [Branchiostoma belcheri]